MNLPLPEFVFEERIPPHKSEPEHFHVDLFYVITVPMQEIRRNNRESHDLRWFTYEETQSLRMFDNTRELLRRLFT